MRSTRVSRHVNAPRASVYRDGGTDIHAVHEALPPGVSSAENELGRKLSLAKLAALVEAGW